MFSSHKIVAVIESPSKLHKQDFSSLQILQAAICDLEAETSKSHYSIGILRAIELTNWYNSLHY